MGMLCKIFEVRMLISKDSLVISRTLRTKYNNRGYSSLSCSDSRENKSSTTYQPIGDFYEGKSILITGGTGYLGKVFIEKLLYSCTKLDKIYFLIRDKKGDNVNKRIKNLFENPLYSRLKEKQPQFMKKLVPITGDMTLPNLGLKPEDEQTLKDKVSVVFHSAANVKFNEPLPVAMSINFEGTQKILKLSQRMKNIAAFVYVSTAFSQPEWKVLTETTYPAPAKLEDVYKFIEEYGHYTTETKKFIKGKPNTYTFTKALSEAYIANNYGDMPTVIMRPSIVTPIKEGPAVGWVDNWAGATSLLYNVAAGWNRINVGDGNNRADFIPVDYVTNMSIIAAAKANKSKIQVYNCTTSSENPITWGEAYKYFTQEASRLGKNEMPYPGALYTESEAVVSIGTFFLQTVPAYIADLWLRVAGQEPKYVKTISHVLIVRNLIAYFTSHSWVMRADRARELSTSLSPEDRKEFPCDPVQINWKEYTKDYCKGVYRYLKPRYTTKS